ELMIGDPGDKEAMEGLEELLEKSYEGLSSQDESKTTANPTKQVQVPTSVPQETADPVKQETADPTKQVPTTSVPQETPDPSKQVLTSVPQETADPTKQVASVEQETADRTKQVPTTSVPQETADPSKQVPTSVPQETADPTKQVPASVEHVTADPTKQVPASVEHVTADPTKQVQASVEQVTADPTKQPQGMSDMPMMPPEVKAWLTSMMTQQGNTSTASPEDHVAGFMRSLSQQSLSSNATSAPGTPATTVSKEETPDYKALNEACQAMAKQQAEADEQCFMLELFERAKVAAEKQAAEREKVKAEREQCICERTVDRNIPLS
ncbi:unnamed protein product, partial [Symbiodinium sp. CCMP2592]